MLTVKLLSKLTLFTALSKILLVLLFIWLLPGLVKDVASSYTSANLREQEKKVLSNIRRNGIDFYFEGDSSYGSYTMLKEEYISLEPVPVGVYRDSIQTSRRIIETDTMDYRILTHAFQYHNKTYLLEIGKTLASIDQYTRPLQKVALYALTLLIAFSLVADLIFTRLLLRPLGVIIRTKLLHRKFPFRETLRPIKTSTTDFTYLDNALIELMGSVKEAFDKEREFTSNASHELMTPISILQTRIENLMGEESLSDDAQDKIAAMLTTLNRLKKIVKSLLLISRIDNDQYVRKETAVPAQLVSEVARELEDRIAARDISFTAGLSGGVIIKELNHDLLFQLLYNLVNNAIRYNRDGGRIQVSDSFESGNYILHIMDTGVGIAEADLPLIFNRFKKSSGAEGEGYGLGLAIVKSIASYHHIGITIQSTPGSGTTVNLHFPLSMILPAGRVQPLKA